MVERQLYAVIEEGLQYFIDEPVRFEIFLNEELRLSAEEAAKVRIYFEGGTDADGNTVEASPPTIVHGYARTGGLFPCLPLTLGSENIAQDYLGKDAPFLDSDGERYVDARTGAVVDPKARRFEYVFNLMVIADHPDITRYYYSLLKHILMSGQDELEERDVEDMTLSGTDLAPDARYLPSDMFIRNLAVTCQGDETWSENLPSPWTDQVNVAIDDTGEGATEGSADNSVTAGVTPVADGS
jgi:hypothetical protein